MLFCALFLCPLHDRLCSVHHIRPPKASRSWSEPDKQKTKHNSNITNNDNDNDDNDDYHSNDNIQTNKHIKTSLPPGPARVSSRSWPRTSRASPHSSPSRRTFSQYFYVSFSFCVYSFFPLPFLLSMPFLLSIPFYIFPDFFFLYFTYLTCEPPLVAVPKDRRQPERRTTFFR